MRIDEHDGSAGIMIIRKGKQRQVVEEMAAGKGGLLWESPRVRRARSSFVANTTDGAGFWPRSASPVRARVFQQSAPEHRPGSLHSSSRLLRVRRPQKFVPKLFRPTRELNAFLAATGCLSLALRCRVLLMLEPPLL